LHQACASALEALAAAGRANASVATALQVERLHALLDGLAVHTAVRPDLMPPEQIVSVVRLHLDALVDEADPSQPTASV
jgi:BetI-type transcriptional repressor, C-terminal